jgi:phage shock protein C
MIGGVCGGIAEYLNTDETIIRLAMVFLTIFSTIFPGVLLYIIAWIIIPEDKGVEPYIDV